MNIKRTKPIECIDCINCIQRMHRVKHVSHIQRFKCVTRLTRGLFCVRTLLRLPVILLMISSGFATASTESTTTTASVQTATPAIECVILLHGLARTSASMTPLQRELIDAGFVVAKLDYPSRKQSVEELAEPTLERGLSQCREQGAIKIHVVAHSMGGILFRQYVEDNGAAQFARTIMLAPPNKGSEAVDALRNVPGFRWLNGPAGLQMGTDSQSVPLKLGPASSDVAIIAGTFSINLILSTYLPDPDDGKVSVESTRLDGMCAHLQVHVSHPYIMKDKEVITEIINYLKTDRFLSERAEYPACAFRTTDKG